MISLCLPNSSASCWLIPGRLRNAGAAVADHVLALKISGVDSVFSDHRCVMLRSMEVGKLMPVLARQASPEVFLVLGGGVGRGDDVREWQFRG